MFVWVGMLTICVMIYDAYREALWSRAGCFAVLFVFLRHSHFFLLVEQASGCSNGYIG